VFLEDIVMVHGDGDGNCDGDGMVPVEVGSGRLC
jgi:hypothetical protein